MRINFLLPPLLFALAALWSVFAFLLERRQRELTRQACVEMSERLAVAERSGDNSLRLLRAAGSELREEGLALLGQSELCQPGEAAGWAAIAARLLAMADDLQDHAPPSPESRVLVRELIAAKPLITRCIDAVAANVRPSLRMWKLSPELETLQLHADQRALAQVLLRVLSNAARSTRHLDFIEVGVDHAPGQVTLTVQDEGNGLLAAPAWSSAEQPCESRGFGLGLSVAKSLVQAHGGDLSVDSVRGVGARVAVSLPRLRTG